jgi:hypothetical protein
MDEFAKLAKAVKVATRKLARRMGELYDKQLIPKDFIYSQFKTAHVTVTKLTNYCDEVNI